MKTLLECSNLLMARSGPLREFTLSENTTLNDNDKVIIAVCVSLEDYAARAELDLQRTPLPEGLSALNLDEADEQTLAHNAHEQEHADVKDAPDEPEVDHALHVLHVAGPQHAHELPHLHEEVDEDARGTRSCTSPSRSHNCCFSARP